jgi:hypothetical protein
MFVIMRELTQRELPVEERIDKALAAIKDAIAALKSGADVSSADIEIKFLQAEMAVNEVTGKDGDVFRNSLFVQYEIDFSAWKIVDLWPETEEDFVKMKAAVESCVVLTDAEQAAWQEDYDYRFGDGAEEVDDWPGLATLCEADPQILPGDEQGGN